MRELLIQEMQANAQNFVAWINLGNQYYSGDGRVQDNMRARICYEEALRVNQNSSAAYYNLGLIYKNGYGVAIDLNYAKNYFRASIAAWETPERKYEEARKCLLEIEMVQNNWNTAEQWALLGNKYYTGDGLAPDYTNARLCYEQALNIQPTHGTAHCHLGFIYKQGLGVASDMVKAADCFEKAAAQGEENAKRELLRLALPNNQWMAYISSSQNCLFGAVVYNNLAKTQELILQGCSINTRCVELSDSVGRTIDSFLHEPSKGVTTLFAGGAMLASGGILLPLTGAIISSFGLSGTLSSMIGVLCGDKQRFLSPYHKQGWTILHFAAAGGAKEVALYLIGEHAKTDVVDAAGRTFLDIARECGHTKFCAACEGAITLRDQGMRSLADVQRQAIQERQRAQALAQELDAARQREEDANRRAQGLNGNLEQLQQHLQQANAQEQQRNEQIRAQNERLARFEPVAVIPGDGIFHFESDIGLPSPTNSRTLRNVGGNASVLLFVWPNRQFQTEEEQEESMLQMG